MGMRENENVDLGWVDGWLGVFMVRENKVVWEGQVDEDTIQSSQILIHISITWAAVKILGDQDTPATS